MAQLASRLVSFQAREPLQAEPSRSEPEPAREPRDFFPALTDETREEDGEEQKIHEQGAGGRTRDDDLAGARSDRQNPICILAGTTTPVAEEKQKKEDVPHRKEQHKPKPSY